MAMRKICPRCGRINEVTAWECEYCKGDIESEKNTNIPSPNHKKLFCNPETKEYTDTPPVDLEKLEAKAEAEKEEEVVESEVAEEIKAEELSDTEEIKTCPVCERINKATEAECPCGKSLKRVPAVSVPRGSVKTWEDSAKERGEDTSEKEISKNVTIEEAISEATREYEEKEAEGDLKYYILIGAGKDENRINIDFVDGVFKIGAYFQKCLYDKMFVSGEHCYLKVRDGKIYLYESTEKPSTNGTYLRKDDGSRERITPGREYPVENGSIFYACNVIIALFKRL